MGPPRSTAYRRPFTWLIAATCHLLLTFTPAIVAKAQTVQGTVQDAATGVPIHMALVALVATDDRIVGQSVTDESGQFFLRPHEAAAYRIRATRMGYASVTTNVLVLVPGQDTVLDLHLQPSAITLAPIEAVAAARVSRRLARVGFYDRRARGFGYFRTPDDIEALHPVFPSDLFWSMPGIRVLSNGRLVTSSFHQGCNLSVAVDGFVVQWGGRAGDSSTWTQFLHVSDIEAIEVYPRPAGVPAWLSGSVSPCGALVIWTKGSSH